MHVHLWNLEREGSFSIPLGQSARCGELTTVDYNYKIHITVSERTPEGWVLDNHAVPEIVGLVVSNRPESCEEICNQLCEHFLMVLGERCHSLEVAIQGIPGSWIRKVLHRQG